MKNNIQLQKLTLFQRDLFLSIRDMQKRLSEIESIIKVVEVDLERNKNIKSMIERDIQSKEQELLGT